MRITLNELRRIIREALDEYTPEEIREFEQDEKLYSELIIQAMKNASKARMRILSDPNIPAREKPELIRSAHELEMLAVDDELLNRAKHSKQDIMKYTEDKTRGEIERRKADEEAMRPGRP